MNERRNEEPMRDEDFVRRVADAYEPPALSPSRRVALDERVRARITRRKRTRLFAPLVTAAAAAALMFVLRDPDEPVDTVASRAPLGTSADKDSAAASPGAASSTAPRETASAAGSDTASSAAPRETASAAGSDAAISVAARTNRASAAGAVESSSAAARAWEYGLLFDGPFDTQTGATATYRADELPDEYEAITDVLLASAAGWGEG